MLVSVVFWAVFKQNGTALTTWAKYYTDRGVPAYAEQTLDDLKLLEKVKTGNDTVDLYDANFNLVKKNKVPVKVYGKDIYLRNLSYDSTRVNEEIKVINTELYQSINPFWVVCLTPLVVAFFVWMKGRGKEVSTPTKIAWGLFISALSPLVMVAAVVYCNNGMDKASSWWLVATYGVVTVGELCLSPMGLSLVSKLSPPRLTALMMGGWFLSTSLGNKLSGILASMWDKYEHKQWFFMTNSLLLLVATIVIVLLLKWLNAIFKEYSH